MHRGRPDSVDSLIARLQERIHYVPAIEMDACTGHSSDLNDDPPGARLSPPEIESVENRLGFRLPTLVRRLAMEVADGGYGPAWGINRLKHPTNLPFGPWYDVKMSVESWHKLFTDKTECPPELMTHYPKHFIRYCELGCNISICIDCTTDQPQLFRDDPMSGSTPSESLFLLEESLEQWLLAWLKKRWPKHRYR